METLDSTFASIKTQKDKAFVGREQKFIYIPKPKPPNMPKSDGLHNGTYSWIPKTPISTNHVLEEFIDIDGILEFHFVTSSKALNKSAYVRQPTFIPVILICFACVKDLSYLCSNSFVSYIYCNVVSS